MFEEVIQLKSKLVELFDDYYNLHVGNVAKLEELEGKLKQDETFTEFYRRISKLFTYFSSGFSKGFRALESKSGFAQIAERKTNLWYTEFRIYELMKKFPRYYLKEYVFPIVMLNSKLQLIEKKILQLDRNLLAFCSKFLSTDASAEEHKLVKELEVNVKSIQVASKKEILGLVNPEFQSIISRTLDPENDMTQSCCLSRTQNLNKFFDLYVIKLKRTLTLSEYFIAGSILVENEAKKAIAVLDVRLSYRELRQYDTSSAGRPHRG